MRFGTNISVLNSLGDCHLALGQKEEALTAYEKSLEIEPNQEKIKALIRTLKEKK
jgi:predicted negative regulator of RcsB-dependent stress response